MLLQKSQFNQYKHLMEELRWSRTTKWMPGNAGEPVAFFVRVNQSKRERAAINGQWNLDD
jgi:hypothetical protein